MTNKPDVVSKLSDALRNTFPGAQVTVGSTGRLSMVTTDQDTFTIQIERTSRLDAIFRASRDQ